MVLPEAEPIQKRRPITDPEILARRRTALAKARAERAEKLAAARANDRVVIDGHISRGATAPKLVREVARAARVSSARRRLPAVRRLPA